MPSKESSSSRSKTGRSSRRGERSTRNGSSRTHGAANDDAAHSNNSPYQQSVRAAESRFSLTDQFASTAREYEFGFDDASSVFTKITDVADSQTDQHDDDDENPVVADYETAGSKGPLENVEEEHDYVEPDHYDILCLPHNSTLTQDQIRQAFYRQFMLLYPEAHASKYRAMAATHFIKSQQAYETLMDPQRRAEYDVIGEDGDEIEVLVHGNYDAAVEGKLRARMQQVVYGASEVGVRIDASKLYTEVYRQLSKRRTPSAANLIQGMKPLDYALSQSFTVGVPVHRVLPLAQLRAAKNGLAGVLGKFKRGKEKEKEKNKRRSKDREREKAAAKANDSSYYLAVPTVTVAASLYGLVDGLTQANVSSSLLTDRFQPLLPLTIPRHRIIQLGELKCTPLVAVRVRQEIIHRARSAANAKNTTGSSSSAAAAGAEERWTKSAIEIETDVIPERSLTARVSHSFLLPYSAVPWNMEASATNGRYVTGGIPRLGMGIYRKVGPGTAFFRADSGDWRFGNGKVCNFFGQFAKESKKWFYADFQFPLKTTPSIEIGYKTTPCERWTTTNYADIPRGESGIRGMDREASFAGRGSWAMSVSAMPGDAFAGYLRYSRDIPYLAPTQTPSRIEAELCGGNASDHYLALRNLWQVGRFARLGLEVSISAHHVHLSLYWARLSQAISLPVLVTPRTMISDKMVALGAVVPFVTVAIGQIGRRFLRRSRVVKKMKREPEAVQAYVDQKRSDAEEIVYLIESFVEARQKREAKKGGLVILSAKYGIQEGSGSAAVWVGEVADVRVALSALVDGDGRLEIPYGVRKSHIPGFWDPVPLQEKVLHVRYMYRGREAVVDVRGKEGLVLPPM
ncbi:hypothetical protein BROUX41_000170 [Berkeleyomyces rouxiae]|uniref:uncharacterized protein n=1 Tax=Berkeleyomyces rouxiae TaxID=2035830 RepID=UPI003B7BFAA0